MAQKHSGWSTTFSGSRASSQSRARKKKTATSEQAEPLSSEQLRQAIAAADSGPGEFTDFVATLQPSG